MSIKNLIIDTLSCLDWISPTVAILGDVAHGGGVNDWTFFFPFREAAAAGWSPFHIVGLLTSKGVSVRGYMLRANTVTLKVPLRQAAWAEYILKRAGVPMTASSEGAPGGPAEFELREVL